MQTVDSFDETEVVVGQAPWELGGTLTVPRGHGPHPAVVLVHGSGYADRDVTRWRDEGVPRSGMGPGQPGGSHTTL